MVSCNTQLDLNDSFGIVHLDGGDDDGLDGLLLGGGWQMWPEALDRSSSLNRSQI